MATLEAIYFNLSTGAAVTAGCMILFHFVVRSQTPLIAPRAAARPKNVIHNPDPNRHRSQNRGKTWFGWIWWVMQLDYNTLLTGIPGTGTRCGGLEGAKLKVNLEGVVFLIFVQLCTRICFITTIVYTLILLPIYRSSQCRNDSISEEEVYKLPGCASILLNLTNFELLSIANIPSISDADNFSDTARSSVSGISARLYVVAFMGWFLCAIVGYEIRRAFQVVLAFRRIYYLEVDVWKERKAELKETLLYNEMQQPNNEVFTFSDPDIKRSQYPKERHLIDRDPWIPHPEQRDTVPNVALYSVLVGGLPSLPEQAVNSDNAETVMFSERQGIDWQLTISACFFDQSVENQPGFSSSVAAVTVIPSSSEIGYAWRKWYKTTAILRKIRALRGEIQKRLDAEGGDVEMGLPQESKVESLGPLGLETPRRIYASISANKEYFKEMLGSPTDKEKDSHVFDAISFGPEQAGVYGREYAQAAASCCPFGCVNLSSMSIEDLEDLEEDLADQLRKANEELVEARRRAAKFSSQAPESHLSVESNASHGNCESTVPSATLSSTASVSGSKPIRGHRRDKTIESATFPDALSLEAKLYKVASNDKDYAAEKNRLATASGDSRSSELSIFDDKTSGAANVNRTEALVVSSSESESMWHRVQSLVAESRSKSIKETRVFDGSWRLPSFRALYRSVQESIGHIGHWSNSNTKAAIETMTRESTYAVVTFTSRHAAAIARQTLADSRGANRWVVVDEIPVPPLADASACDLSSCRNCCRPVTMTISDRQKAIRHLCTLLFLNLFFVFYTVPLTFIANTLGDPQVLEQIFPAVAEWASDNELEVFGFISGALSGLTFTTFFAFCPLIFKAVSNFGSKAASAVSAEYKALQYYWWFMLFIAFTGTLIASMILRGINDGLRIGSELRTVLREIASSIPGALSFTWMNWIIFQALVVLPCNYLLQANTFIFSFLGWNCCSRVTQGGGPGGPMPYRLYVNSGIVLLCNLALGIQSPLVAPASLLYFIMLQPILRRNLIFVYRPKFDGGGMRWPFLFDMVISSLMIMQVLLVTQMGLKQAFGPFLVCLFPFPFIYLFRKDCLKSFSRAFMDNGLYQTSMLDGMDTSAPSSMKEREEFRRFLVDAHKAAYTPVCLSGPDTAGLLTVEPAVVIPQETDTDAPGRVASEESLELIFDSQSTGKSIEGPGGISAVQKGATLRRAANALKAMRQRHYSLGSLETGSTSRIRDSRPSLDASEQWVSLIDRVTERGGKHQDL